MDEIDLAEVDLDAAPCDEVQVLDVSTKREKLSASHAAIPTPSAKFPAEETMVQNHRHQVPPKADLAPASPLFDLKRFSYINKVRLISSLCFISIHTDDPCLAR